MRSKWPDTQLRRELREFNREFLALVCADARPGSAYGLQPAVRERLGRLTPAQLEAIAETPCLLAAIVVLPSRHVPRGVADAPCLADPTSAAGRRISPAQAEAARLFSASLLTWLWHTARHDGLLAARLMCVGPGQAGVEGLRGAGFQDLQRIAAGAVDSLEARFCRHPRLWPDLVRAAAHADAQLLTATRLSVVQLTLISRR